MIRNTHNTVIGADIVAKAAPDGYTLLLAIDSTLAMNPSLYSKLPYDPLKDFSPIGLIAEVPCVIAVNPSLPVKNLQQLLDFSRSKPGVVNYAHGTITMHVGGELLNQMAGVKMVPVAYRGGGTSIVALMGGEVQVTMEAAATVLPHLSTGKVRALAVMGSKRLRTAPEIPIVSETVPGYNVAVWQSLVAPAGTPRPIIDRLNLEARKAMELPAVRERLEKIGLEPLTSSPEDLAKLIRSETVKWSKVIKDVGLKID